MLYQLKSYIKYWLSSVLNSYSQIFFSLNKVLALIIILATFFTPHLGAIALLSVVMVNVMAHIFGISRKLIEEGLFGFNALLFGLALSFNYEINSTFFLLLTVSIGLLLIISVWVNGLFHKFSLPFLSIPFVLTYWITHMAIGNFSKITFNEDHIYAINHLAELKRSDWYLFVHQFDRINVPKVVLIFLKTIAMTFFQTSVLAGIIISIGILYFSRIVFSLTVLGFSFAYLFYSWFGADVNDLNVNLVGSNFIFMAIGIGCFYLIPNIYSYITVFLLTPILLFVMIFFNKILSVFQLSSFTLSFSIVVILFLLFLHHRWFHKFLHLITIQYYSPEKTIYKYLTSVQRFKNAHLAKIALPFWGEWFVSQGYDGKITHLGKWGKALDFVIVDDEKKTFNEVGTEKKDFYCYNKPIVAPLDGYVYDIINNVEDNEIAGVNTDQNWGNTIILNHVNGLFTQISHVKKDSFKVNIGDYVTKGTLLATCGNSGRSPEPHIHFQVQTTPKLGEVTLAYPIAYFIEKEGKNQQLKISEIPKEETIISNVVTNSLLTDSFNLYPGLKLKWTNNTDEQIVWEVFTDQYNRTYLYCHKSKSIAYFVNDGTMFYFYDFEGSKKSLLFHFYLGSYRILLGCYENIEAKDSLPLIHFNNKTLQWIQDFLSPVYLFTKAFYTSKTINTDNINDPKETEISANVSVKFMNISFKKVNYSFQIKENKIESFKLVLKGTKTEYLCEY